MVVALCRSLIVALKSVVWFSGSCPLHRYVNHWLQTAGGEVQLGLSSEMDGQGQAAGPDTAERKTGQIKASVLLTPTSTHSFNLSLIFKSTVRGTVLLCGDDELVFWWVIPGSEPLREDRPCFHFNLPHAETVGAAQSENSAKPHHITHASVEAICPVGSRVILCHPPKFKQGKNQSLELLPSNLLEC